MPALLLNPSRNDASCQFTSFGRRSGTQECTSKMKPGSHSLATHPYRATSWNIHATPASPTRESRAARGLMTAGNGGADGRGHITAARKRGRKWSDHDPKFPVRVFPTRTAQNRDNALIRRANKPNQVPTGNGHEKNCHSRSQNTAQKREYHPSV